MAAVFSTFPSGLSSCVSRRSRVPHNLHFIRSATNATEKGKRLVCFPPRNPKTNFNIMSSPGRSPQPSNNPQKAATNPKVPAIELSDQSLDNFIPGFESLIQAKRQTIEAAKRKRFFNPFAEELAESFYHMKGQHTRATCFSQDQIPALFKNIINRDYRRDFVLYKDIPTLVVISDFVQNFGIKESPQVEHLEYEPIPLSHDAPLPKGYQSVLLEGDETLPRGYHIVLNSPFIRIFSHVTRRELFQSWKLDQQEREKQVRAMYRRNKWPFTEKV